MEQYIPKSALVAEINKRIIDAPINSIGHQRVWAYNDVKDIINTLVVKEVNLEKELGILDNAYFEFNGVMVNGTTIVEEMKAIAKHFFELGLKAQHNSISIPNIDDIFEENSIDPNSKDAKILKECYYIALEKLKAYKL
jgi:hypothetical protein